MTAYRPPAGSGALEEDAQTWATCVRAWGAQEGVTTRPQECRGIPKGGLEGAMRLSGAALQTFLPWLECVCDAHHGSHWPHMVLRSFL